MGRIATFMRFKYNNYVLKKYDKEKCDENGQSSGIHISQTTDLITFILDM